MLQSLTGRAFATVTLLGSLTAGMTIGTQSAGAASFQQWSSMCGKWVNDVSKVDSQIQRDNSGARIWLNIEIDFAALAVDGRHITSQCATSPDRTLNTLMRNYGNALYAAGVSCASWASTNGTSYSVACINGITREKSLQNSTSNRMQQILG